MVRHTARCLWLSDSVSQITQPPLVRDYTLHAVLRTTHTLLAYVFFATILLHVAGALFQALIRRDAVFRAMAGIGPRNQ